MSIQLNLAHVARN